MPDARVIIILSLFWTHHFGYILVAHRIYKGNPIIVYCCLSRDRDSTSRIYCLFKFSCAFLSSMRLISTHSVSRISRQLPVIFAPPYVPLKLAVVRDSAYWHGSKMCDVIFCYNCRLIEWIQSSGDRCFRINLNRLAKR
jgi:hypothetical protein